MLSETVDSDAENKSFLPGHPNYQAPETEDEESDQEHPDAQPSVLQDRFLNNKHTQYISNHPSKMAKTRSSGKNKKQDAKAKRREQKRKRAEEESEEEDSGSETEDTTARLKEELKKLKRVADQAKAEARAAKSRGSGSRSNARSTQDAIDNVIVDVTKDVLFPRTPFVNPNNIEYATSIVMDGMDILEHEGMEPKELKKAEDKWIQDKNHQKLVRITMNNQRNYHQTQLVKLFKATIDNPDFELPTPEEIEMVAKRQGLTDRDPNHQRMRAVFLWYWDKMMPIISSNKRWGTGKRNFNLMSFARPEGDMSKPTYVTVSDEAYAVVMWKNYHDFWVFKKKLQDEDREPTEEEKKKPEAKPVWTQQKAGVCPWGGWDKEGRRRHRELKVEIKVTKGNAEGTTNEKKKFKHVQDVEKACLAQIHEKKAIDPNGRSKRRNPAVNKALEIDSDCEPDW